MSKGYFKDHSGTQNLIDNVFLDHAGVLQTLSNNFLKHDTTTQQIFFTTGIPMSAIAGHARLYEATDLRLFEATDVRIFEV